MAPQADGAGCEGLVKAWRLIYSKLENYFMISSIITNFFISKCPIFVSEPESLVPIDVCHTFSSLPWRFRMETVSFNI